MSLVKRIAHRHLKADSYLIGSIRLHLGGLEGWVDTLAFLQSTLKALIVAGEARRLGRTSDIKILSQKGYPPRDGKVEAVMQGTTGKYDTRITFKPQRGHHCTCPDWQKRGRQVGPCKHVLALGRYWLDEKVTPALEIINEDLQHALEKSDV